MAPVCQKMVAVFFHAFGCRKMVVVFRCPQKNGPSCFAVLKKWSLCFAVSKNDRRVSVCICGLRLSVSVCACRCLSAFVCVPGADTGHSAQGEGKHFVAPMSDCHILAQHFVATMSGGHIMASTLFSDHVRWPRNDTPARRNQATTTF